MPTRGLALSGLCVVVDEDLSRAYFGIAVVKCVLDLSCVLGGESSLEVSKQLGDLVVLGIQLRGQGIDVLDWCLSGDLVLDGP